MKRVLIGVPTHHGVCDSFRRGYGELQENGLASEWDYKWIEVGGCGVTVARNFLAAKAIKENYDALLFLAGDMGFRDNCLSRAVDQVLSHFERPDVHVVGGVYLFKKFPYRLVVDQDRNRQPDAHGLIEVRACGTDFMAISAESFRTVIGKWPHISKELYGSEIPLAYDSNLKNADLAQGIEWNLFSQAVVGSEFVPEDFYYCMLARESGQRIYVDTQIRLQHWGSFNFDAGSAHGVDEALQTAMPRALHSVAFS